MQGLALYNSQSKTNNVYPQLFWSCSLKNETILLTKSRQQSWHHCFLVHKHNLLLLRHCTVHTNTELKLLWEQKKGECYGSLKCELAFWPDASPLQTLTDTVNLKKDHQTHIYIRDTAIYWLKCLVGAFRDL